MQNFFVYIAYNKRHDKFYIGQTNNTERRELEHCLGFSAYTSRYDGRWEISYREKFSSRAEAMQREKLLKKQKSKPFYRKLCKMS
jgi:putative endonuclease